MSEIWKPVVGYKGLYKCSNLGRIKSLSKTATGNRSDQHLKEKIIGKNQNSQGYHRVNLYKDGKSVTYFVHQIIAEAWFGKCPDGLEVCHGPAGLQDNSLGNIRYGTRSENCLDKRRDGTHGGKPVRRGDGLEFCNAAKAAEETGCNKSGIQKVCSGKMTTSGGYHWNYIQLGDTNDSDIREGANPI